MMTGPMVDARKNKLSNSLAFLLPINKPVTVGELQCIVDAFQLVKVTVATVVDKALNSSTSIKVHLKRWKCTQM